MASNPQLTEGIAAGDFDYAYPDIASITQAVIDKGAPVGIVVPEGDSVAGVHYNAAVLGNAGTRSGQVFINWLMSERGATSLAEHLQPAVTPVKVEGASRGTPWTCSTSRSGPPMCRTRGSRRTSRPTSTDNAAGA